MKQIIPFKKDILFKTKLSDIISISLEHKTNINKKDIYVEFIISGEYKMTESSVNKETFNYNIPFELDIDKKYDISKVKIDIDDFYYEIINDEILRVNISLLLDNLNLYKEEKKDIKENLEKFSEDSEITILDIDENSNNMDEIDQFNNLDNRENVNEESDKMLEEEIKDEVVEEDITDKKSNNTKIMNNIFNTMKDEETFKTYHVYIAREDDTFDKITKKYNVTKEIINEYNNIDKIKAGDKIIIPCTD